MIVTLATFLATLALCLAAGIAIIALLEPEGRWFRYEALPLGAAGLILLLYPFSLVAPVSIAVWLCLGLVACGVLIAWLRRRRIRGEPLGPSWSDGAVLGGGGVAGIVALTPVFAQGFPTTLGVSIADGWSRAVFSQLLMDEPLTVLAHVTPRTAALDGYGRIPTALGVGYELLCGAVATVTGQLSYHVLLVVSAVGIAGSVAGWAMLARALADRELRRVECFACVPAAFSPLLLAALVDNYLTQLFSLCLLPFALAATVRWARAPTPGRLLVAALGVGAVVAVYTPMLPWIAIPVGVAVLAAVDPGRLKHLVGLRPSVLRRVLAGVLAAVPLGLAVLAVAPVAVIRAVSSVGTIAGLRSAAAWPLLPLEQDLGFAAGALDVYSLPAIRGGVWSAHLTLRLALALAVAALGLAALVVQRRREGGVSLALAGAVLAVTGALHAKYTHVDHYGYGAYKALMSGGALLNGLLIVALVLGLRTRLRPAAAFGLGLVALVWLAGSMNLLERQARGTYGFRQAEHRLEAALDALPARGVLLVEGAWEAPDQFRLRQATSYFGVAAFDRPTEGLGTTFSYVAGGGALSARPSRPWDYVISMAGPTPVGQPRQTILADPVFEVRRAPALDVTPYAVSPVTRTADTGRQGRAWQPPERDALGEFAWTSGPVELIVANRRSRPVRVRLQLRLQSFGIDRLARFSSAGAPPQQVRVSGRRLGRYSYVVPVPARGTSVVGLTSRPGPLPVPGSLDTRRLALRVQDVRVGPAG